MHQHAPEQSRSRWLATALAARADRREPVHRADLVGDVVVGVVEERRAQVAHLALHLDPLVRLDAAAAPPRLAEEAQLRVWIPVAVADPAAHVPNLAREVEAVDSVRHAAAQHREDLLAQRRRNGLVRVDEQDPFAAREVARDRLLPDVAHPSVLEDAVGERPGDFHRAVRAEGVDDDDLVRERHALQAAGDVVLLVAGDDADGEEGLFRGCGGFVWRGHGTLHRGCAPRLGHRIHGRPRFVHHAVHEEIRRSFSSFHAKAFLVEWTPA